MPKNSEIVFRKIVDTFKTIWDCSIVLSAFMHILSIDKDFCKAETP
jgi:hypothetical protein